MDTAGIGWYKLCREIAISLLSEAQMKSDRIKRRDFITLLGGAAVVQSLGAYAQTPKLPTIGFLSAGPARAIAKYIDAFREAMGGMGYVQGRTVAITYRSAEGSPD